MDDSSLTTDIERLIESLGQFPEPVAKPTFVAVIGLPGSGKSYFSSQLAERLSFIILESDALRKILFPSPTYNQPESFYLFRVIHCLIEKLLKRGVSLILDATNLTERHREYLYKIADQLSVKLILVRVEAPAEVVRQRLESRLEDLESKSAADWVVYQRMKPSVERIQRKHYVVDTSRNITPVLDKIVREVRR